ncbi:MAG: TonB family protein [Candidatus Eisenbacteria bacterium]|nr:TonB family protein [Candidatus Eisenbacteria bacterium]
MGRVVKFAGAMLWMVFLISMGAGMDERPRGDRLTIYLRPGVIIFPMSDDGLPLAGLIPRDSVAFVRGSRVSEVLDSLGWIGCEKAVPGLLEGDTITATFGTKSIRGSEPPCYYDELDSRAYTVYFPSDSAWAEEWILTAGETVAAIPGVDSVEYHWVPRGFHAPGWQPGPIVMNAAKPRDPGLGLRGKVYVRIRVSPEGKVAGASVEKSTLPQEYEKAALEAARRWTFKDVPRRGRAKCEVQLVIPIEFPPEGSKTGPRSGDE